MKEIDRQTITIEDNYEIRIKGKGRYQKVQLIYDNITYKLTGCIRTPRKGEVFSVDLITYETRFGDTKYVANHLRYDEKHHDILDYITWIFIIPEAIFGMLIIQQEQNLIIGIALLAMYYTIWFYNLRRGSFQQSFVYFSMLILNSLLLFGFLINFRI